MVIFPENLSLTMLKKFLNTKEGFLNVRYINSLCQFETNEDLSTVKHNYVNYTLYCAPHVST
jgi:hypothetical protein